MQRFANAECSALRANEEPRYSRAVARTLALKARCISTQLARVRCIRPKAAALAGRMDCAAFSSAIASLPRVVVLEYE